MFKPEYKDTQSYLTPPHPNSKPPINLSSDMDLMYQLYSKYLSISKQQITLQQLLIIKDTQTFLQSIGRCNNINITGIKNKDTTSTVDSFSIDQDLENSCIMHDFTTIERRCNKKITRKGRSSKLNINKNDTHNDQVYEILRQVEVNCSQKTYEKIKYIINQHRKNSTKFIDIQNKQISSYLFIDKKMNKIQQNSDKYQQQNLLLKAQLQELQNKLKSKDQQIKQFKQKLNQFKIQKIKLLTNKFIKINQIIIIITVKQTLFTQLKKIQQLQKNIQKRLSSFIQSNYITNQNKKSYEIVSNLKKSLLDYREYLQLQATEYDRLFNILKKQMQRSIVELSQHKIPVNN